MIKVFLSLGTNLGNKRVNLSTAIREIGEKVGDVTILSGIYETEAWGFKSGNNFLNQVIQVLTDMKPPQLINCCLEIEKEMGRERSGSGNYESRIIDIDILFYGDLIVNEDNLIIPHPQLHKRRFILEPLNEIAQSLVHPSFGKTISMLLAECTDAGRVSLSE